MKKRKGASTLILLIGIFVVLVVFGTIITSYTMNNSLNARLQKERIQAYYLVMSGIELATDALLQTDPMDSTQTPILLNEYKENPHKGALTHTIDDVSGLFHISSDDAELDGKIEIAINTVDREGNLWPAGKDKDSETVWVEIFVTSLVKSQRQEVHYTGKVRMSTIDPANAVWEVDLPDGLAERE